MEQNGVRMGHFGFFEIGETEENRIGHSIKIFHTDRTTLKFILD